MASGDDINEEVAGSGSENISDVVEIDAELWGAYGGHSDYLNEPGNPSVIISGVFDVSDADDLYWYVGGEGTQSSGGFNGGGDPGSQPSTGSVYGGGGGTDIRVGGSGTNDRILVAAGGGGQGWNTDQDYALSGGAAGFDEGGEGISGDGNTIAGGQSPNAFNDPIGNDDFQGGNPTLTGTGGGGGGYWAGYGGATNNPGQSGSGGASYYDENRMIGSVSGTGSYGHNNGDGIVLVDYRLGPQVDFSYDPLPGEIVAGDEVFFIESVTTGYYSISSYFWDLDGSTASGSDATKTYNNPGNYDITLTVTDSEGYSNSRTRTIDVQSGATVDFNVPTDTVQGFDITFTDNTSVLSGESKQSEKWLVDGTQVSTSTDLTYNFSSPGTKNVEKVVTVNGVEYSETKTVTIDDAATVDFTYDGLVVTDISETFTDQTTIESGANRTNEEWVIDGALAGNNTDLNYTFSNPGTYSVGKIVTVNGYDYSAGKNVTVEQNTTADFDYTPSAPLVDENISFSDQSVTPFNITSYSWDFGDGTTATGQNPSHTYTEIGDYNVQLTVEDDQGQTDSTAQIVTVASRTPKVETDFATNIGDFEATLNGNVIDVGVDSSADVYFEYRETGATTWNQTPVQTVSNTGSFSETVTGLSIETEYEYRAVGTNTEGTFNASNIIFSTNDNTPPVVDSFSITPDPITRDDAVDVAIQASDQVGINELLVEWYYNGAQQTSQTFSYSAANSINETLTGFYTPSKFGDHQVAITITDSKGLQQTDTINQSLDADKPTFNLTAPTDGITIGYDQNYSYEFDLTTGNASVSSITLVVLDSSNNRVQETSLGTLAVNSTDSYIVSSQQTTIPDNYQWGVEVDYETDNFVTSSLRSLTVAEPSQVDVETGDIVSGGYGLGGYGDNGYGEDSPAKGFNFINAEGGLIFTGDSNLLDLYFQYRKVGETAWNETGREEYDNTGGS